MNTIKYIWIAGLAVISLCACHDFLNEKPSKSSSLVPTTTEQLDYLFNRYATFSSDYNLPAMFGSDSYGLDVMLTKAKKSIPGINAAWYATWDSDFSPAFSRYSTMQYEYQKIFYANMVLSYIPKVEGSEADKERLEKEAKFIRAYSLFNLVETYCLPYTDKGENKTEMGMTLKHSTSFEELQERATLEATHSAIEADLEEALKIVTDMPIVNNKYKHWRANKAAVNGFAARYWLSRGDYDKALHYAGTALASHHLLVDYNTEMYYSSIPSVVKVNGVSIPILYPYTHDNQSDLNDRMEWKELMWYRMLYNAWWWYIPSKELLAKYDQDHDLRFKYHIVDNYSYDRGVTSLVYPGYIFFFKDCIPSGPTTAECLLIKAECLARQNKIAEAMAEVNKLRDARMDKNAPASIKYLSATSRTEAVKQIIDERWREMPFTLRWYDLRRLNHNNDTSDDIGEITRTYFPYNASTVLTGDTPISYSLKPGSRHYAAPIPNTDITSSNGAIRQNTY